MKANEYDELINDSSVFYLAINRSIGVRPYNNNFVNLQKKEGVKMDN
jgi:hypothetical protein